ncbi:tetratricopeptide repeat protein [Polynucleobacter ibericus]|uniref:O-linked N-acetylglucosamine transferase, SPINDLY family protein n=1 Tax=Polynucleobacter ibericus TaxID=1819725 RepID=UPI001BFDB039|nr:tetratricopeptide repeat protein [Polynucleobacter ibericus]QWE08769.1 tetratricopeptide repeat protein [Polynucleobacter ibericus]
MSSEIIQLLQKATQEIQANRLDSAKLSLEEALKIDSKHTEVLRHLGIVAAIRSDWDDALRFFDLAVQSDQNNFLALSNRGNILKLLMRFDEALQSYEAALLLNPSDVSALCNAATIFNLRHEYGLSLACSERASAISPDNVMAWEEIGKTYWLVKQYEKAIDAFNRVTAIDSSNLNAWLSKANIYAEDKQFDMAQVAYQRASEIAPHLDYLFGTKLQNALQMCDWSNLQDQTQYLINGIRQGLKVALPYNVFTLLDDPQLIKKAISIYANGVQGDIKREIISSYSNHQKIRLGYFSADFHDHPTAHLMAELFESHDREKFELIAFVFGRNQPDEMRSRLAKAFDQFIDVEHKTDREIAALSRELEIDIAIDLKGFTQEGRAPIFMYGAAPIQVSYLAFPGTMGTPCFDYVVADRILIPEDAQSDMVEKIIYLPNSYQVNDRNKQVSLSTKSREEHGLPSTGFVFCCFNNNYKILPAVLGGWIRILNAVEGSVLWLFADNPFAVANLKKEAALRGLNPDRIIFAERIPPAEHLARYKLADLFLDTTPCNAHTTASDALWTGLPVLTLVGKSFAARVAASLLNAVGLPDMVVETQEEYEVLALDLATHPEKLQEIKARLKGNLLTAPLFDTPLFTKNLENAYIEIYKRHQKAIPPEHIYIA